MNGDSVKLAIERVIAKHQVLWVLDQLRAGMYRNPAEYWKLIGDLIAAQVVYRSLMAPQPVPKLSDVGVPGPETLLVFGANQSPRFNVDEFLVAMRARMAPNIQIHRVH